MIGQIFMGRYLIEEHIGSGGMSDVYRGLDLNTGRKVAIKILRDEFAKDADFIRRFHREAQAAAGLTHENLVGVYDLGEEDGFHFIVMEDVNGDTLKEKIRERGALPVEQVIRYGCELCAALEQAHEGNIIHRDIKPQNIIIGRDGSAKLTDFGIARATTSATVTVTDGSVMGSVHYLSPEQARGELAAEQSDLYSLGVVLYEMATGRVPFDGDSPVSIALAHLQEPPADPARYNPLVPPALSKIILKALKKDALDRYQTAGDMYADLERVQEEPEGDYISQRLIDINDKTRLVPIVRGTEDQMAVAQDDAEYLPAEVDAAPQRRSGRGKGALLVLGVIVLACTGLIWLGIRTIAMLTDEQMPIVPQVEKLTLDRAQELLREREYIPLVAQDFSNEIGEGLIIAQEPAPDTQLRKHSVVTITVSLGPEYVEVPDVTANMKYEDALEYLKSLSLVGEAIADPNSDAPRGQVVRQVPQAGYLADNGSTVTLYYSDPPLLRRTPQVKEMLLDEAVASIEREGLKVGQIVNYETTEMEPGRVIRQSPEADVELVEGSQIDLYISAAPEKVYSREEHIVLSLPDGDQQVLVELQDADGKKTQLFNELTAGGDFDQTLVLEERAGTYKLVVYVNGEYHDSWSITFGEE